jgi:hypothetical protein
MFAGGHDGPRKPSESRTDDDNDDDDDANEDVSTADGENGAAHEESKSSHLHHQHQQQMTQHHVQVDIDSAAVEAERVALEAEKKAVQAEEQRESATTYDMFSASPTAAALPGPGGDGGMVGLKKKAAALAEGDDPLLESNWDDWEGYYKTRIGEVIGGR